MKMLHRIIVFLIAYFSFVCATHTYGQTVNNGSLNGTPRGNNRIATGSAAGWTACSATPDLCDVTFPSYVATSQVTPIASPDGGNWLGLAAASQSTECAKTTITGLTPAQTYTLYFCGACFGTGTTSFNSSPAIPRVCVGATCQSYNIPMAASIWTGYQLTFTATAATMTLTASHPSGSNAYASLDGFNLISACGVSKVITQNDTVCLGDSIAMVAYNGDGSYLWYPIGNSTNVLSTNDTCWIKPLTTGTYVVSSGGTYDTTEIYVATIFAEAGTDQNLCTGESINLGGAPSGPPGAIYSWTPSAGISNTAIANPSVSPTSTKKYFLTTNIGPCSETDSITITVFPSGSSTGSTEICQGDSALVHGNYLKSSGVYSQTFTIAGGCDSIATFTLTVNNNPSIVTSPDTLIGSETTAALRASGGTSYSWQPTVNCGNCANPVVSPNVTTTYTVIVTNSDGCTSIDSIKVTVVEFCNSSTQVLVPNIFSPNEDGQNDVLRFYSEGIVTTLYFAVFNRWGEKIHETTDPMDIAWDGHFRGKLCNPGVYTYILKHICNKGEEVVKIGTVSIIQ